MANANAHSSVEIQGDVASLRWDAYLLPAGNEEHMQDPYGGLPFLAVALEQHAKSTPTKTAIGWIDDRGEVVRTITYAELWKITGELAHTLQYVHGLSAGDRALIVYPPDIDFVLAMIACFRLGIIVVSIYPPNLGNLAADLPKLHHFVQDSGAKVALTIADYRKAVHVTSLLHHWPDLTWVATDTCPPIPSHMEPPSGYFMPEHESPAMIQYTSGSTGDPKGVVITHGNLVHQAWEGHSLFYLVGVKVKDVVQVGWAPQYHDLGLIGGYLAMLMGGATTLNMSPLNILKNPLLWPQCLQRYGATYTQGSNFAYALVAKRMREKEMPPFDLHTVAVATFGGEPAEWKTMEDSHHVIGLPKKAIHNGWGLAEHTLAATSWGQQPHEGAASVGSLSLSAYNKVDIRVVCPHPTEPNTFVEVEGGEKEGEVWVCSPSKAAGYWGKPELTQKVFHAQIQGITDRTYLRTGDIGYVRDGELYISGRIKDLIIVQGKNFAPTDLERAAESKFPSQIRPGSSVAFQHGPGSAGLVCEVRDTFKGDLKKLAEDVRRTVQSNCGIVINTIGLVEMRMVPKTTSGKVQRSKARQMYERDEFKFLARVGEDGEDGSEGMKMTYEGVNTIEDLLGAFSIDPLEHGGNTLPQLGFDSMRLVRFTNTARDRLNVEIPMEEMSILTVNEIIAKLRRGEFSIKSEKVNVRIPFFTPTGSTPHVFLRIFMQTVGVLFIFLSVCISAIPSVLIAGRFYDSQNAWWSIDGRAGPLVILCVPLAMGVFTLWLVVCKWVLVGRRRPGGCMMWSVEFTRWWIVDRLAHVWEVLVGVFLLETPWLNVVYKMMGGSIAFSARLDIFLRNWDLVSVGNGAHVKGRLSARFFAEGGLMFAEVKVGHNAVVGSAAVVQLGSVIESGTNIEPRTVVTPFSFMGPGTWSGNPARNIDTPISTASEMCSRDAIDPPNVLENSDDSPVDSPSGSTCTPVTSVTEESLNNGKGVATAKTAKTEIISSQSTFAHEICIGDQSKLSPRGVIHDSPYLFSRISFPFVLLFVITCTSCIWNLAVPALPVGDAFSIAFILQCFVYVATFQLCGITLFAMSVALKWSFVSPWWTDRLSEVVHDVFFPYVAKNILVNLWLMCYGMRLGAFSHPTYTTIVSASVAHLVTVGRGVFLANSSLSPAPGHPIKIGNNCELGVQSRIEAGVEIPDGSFGVGAFTRVKSGTVVGKNQLLVGNPPLVLNSKPTVKNLAAVGMGVHVLLTFVTLGTILCEFLIGLQCMVVLPIYALPPAVYVPIAFGFFVIFLGISFWVNLVAFKWISVGRRRKGSISVGSVESLLFYQGQFLLDMLLSVVGPFIFGSYLFNLVMTSFGANVDVSTVFINEAYPDGMDGELLTYSDWSVVDCGGYASAHRMDHGKVYFSEIRVGSYAVIHPSAGFLCGEISSHAAILPRSKTLHWSVPVPEGEVWAGVPAQKTCVERVNVGGYGHKMAQV